MRKLSIILAVLILGGASLTFAAGDAEGAATGATMSAPGVLPIVDETVTISVAAIPHATVEDLPSKEMVEP